MPKLCIRELDRLLGELPRGSIVLLIGPLDAYVDAVALDVIRRCPLTRDRYAFIYLVNNEPESFIALAESMGVPLRAYREAGLAKVEVASNVISALREAAKDVSQAEVEDTVAIIDATAASWDTGLPSLVESMRVLRRASRGLTLLLVNRDLVRDPTLRAGLAEIVDYPLHLEVEKGVRGISRYIELTYSKRSLINYARVYYTLTSRGVEYSLRLEV